MRDFMVFEEHVLPSWRKSGMSRGPDVWYEQPIGYFSNAATIRGPRDPIEIPGGSERLDFELEVGAVIGREAVSVPPDGAADRIAGFCILCDWSARDLQFREMDGASARSRARISAPRWARSSSPRTSWPRAAVATATTC